MPVASFTLVFKVHDDFCRRLSDNLVPWGAAEVLESSAAALGLSSDTAHPPPWFFLAHKLSNSEPTKVPPTYLTSTTPGW